MMMGCSGVGQYECLSLRSAAVSSALIFASIFLGGCSADVTRFDSTSFNLNDPPETGDNLVRRESVYSSSRGDNQVVEGSILGKPYGFGAKLVQRAALPEASNDQSYASSPQQQPAHQASYGCARTAPHASRIVNGRRTIEVQPGDTLYGVARAYGVKFSELQQVNGTSDLHRVKPGTTLRVPDVGVNVLPCITVNKPPASPLLPVAASSQSALAIPLADQKPTDSPYYGEITMQPIAINSEERVTSGSDKATDASPEGPPVQLSLLERKPTVSGQPTAAAKKQVAITTAPPPPSIMASVKAKLRWPASGKIIAGFGSRPDGTHNDGINLQVPLGTDVHAAEASVVAYAGSELKGYGNLVLLRHDNGWVTAYAHNDELFVKRGDKVKRGQVIAKAGKTGSVDQPQLHFELRQGSRPVDPIPYLERP